MRVLNCTDCGSDMRIANQTRSSNSVYVDWQCTSCLNRKTVCEGVMVLTNW